MILKGKIRRELQDYLAYQRAAWEIEFETSEFYQRQAAKSGATIKPFDREELVSSIPAEYHGVQLRNEPYARGFWGSLRIQISDAFVKETQRRVPGWRRRIEESKSGQEDSNL